MHSLKGARLFLSPKNHSTLLHTPPENPPYCIHPLGIIPPFCMHPLGITPPYFIHPLGITPPYCIHPLGIYIECGGRGHLKKHDYFSLQERNIWRITADIYDMIQERKIVYTQEII